MDCPPDRGQPRNQRATHGCESVVVKMTPGRDSGVVAIWDWIAGHARFFAGRVDRMAMPQFHGRAAPCPLVGCAPDNLPSPASSWIVAPGRGHGCTPRSPHSEERVQAAIRYGHARSPARAGWWTPNHESRGRSCGLCSPCASMPPRSYCCS